MTAICTMMFAASANAGEYVEVESPKDYALSVCYMKFQSPDAEKMPCNVVSIKKDTDNSLLFSFGNDSNSLFTFATNPYPNSKNLYNIHHLNFVNSKGEAKSFVGDGICNHDLEDVETIGCLFDFKGAPSLTLIGYIKR